MTRPRSQKRARQRPGRVPRHSTRTQAHRGRSVRPSPERRAEYVGSKRPGKKARGAAHGPREATLITGRVRLEPDGSGRLSPDRAGTAAVYLPPEELKGLRAGDRATVRLETGRKGRVRGRVVARGARASGRAVGIVVKRGHTLFVEPSPPGPLISLADRATHEAKPGHAVLVRVAEEARGHRPARAEIVRVLGDPSEAQVQIEMLVQGLALPMEFSADALGDTARFKDVDPGRELVDGRRDLRSIAHVTIDGEDARDFDDAVAARKEGEGYRVWVSIADVSHYVEAQTPLDRDARERGTSVYFPQRVVPMLPERLSNELCSLRPKVPRLTLTCEMLVPPSGRPEGVTLYPSLIESMARLTYRQVQDHIDGKAPADSASLAPILAPLVEAARILRQKRLARGALDLDLPELEVLLDGEGVPRYIQERARWEAHSVIEDLMIAANEAVARSLHGRGWPTVYRVHEAPEPAWLRTLASWAERLGITLDAEHAERPQVLAQFLRAIKGRPQAPVVEALLLRSLAQARYSDENLGHYGLASRAYLHFTSPIRRYPDLLVHRSLRALWTQAQPLNGLEQQAADASLCERRAMEAERAVVKLMACQIAAQHLGETMQATVTGVHEAGLFVRGDALAIEGLIPREALGAARREAYDLVAEEQALVARRSGHRFAIGDKVTVRVANVNLARREVDFDLARALR